MAVDAAVSATVIAPGVLIREAHHGLNAVTYADPQRCGEIGCPCVNSKQLETTRSGADVIFFCPSSRICATVGPSTRGLFVLGAHYTGGK
jgi:hypothetical protein